jgi:hypothetical protein
MQQPNSIRVVVLRMEPNMVYEMELKSNGTEQTIDQVLQQNSDISNAIFALKAPNYYSLGYTSLHSIVRLPYPKEHLLYSRLGLQVLMNTSEGTSLQRNANAYQLELFCATQFYGPLVIARNSADPPYSLCDFTINDLKELHDFNQFMSKEPSKSSHQMFYSPMQSTIIN